MYNGHLNNDYHLTSHLFFLLNITDDIYSMFHLLKKTQVSFLDDHGGLGNMCTPRLILRGSRYLYPSRGLGQIEKIA